MSTLAPADLAVRFFRVATALSAAHVLGLSWPPPGRPQRQRVIGHWGANPGIAWIVGHLAARWAPSDPFHLIVGTGHATSFLVAHEALREGWDAETISAWTMRYGQPGGDAAELIGWPEGVPHLFGELGPAVAVSQALATAGRRPTVCVIGDGECETPVALGALAHARVLLARSSTPWLVAVNANGARMGGRARFDADGLSRLLASLGYFVSISGPDPAEADAAAASAIANMTAGRLTAWISVTPKGWPAPSPFLGDVFRGHRAHKLPKGVELDNRDVSREVCEWVAELTRGLLDASGRAGEDVALLAARAVFGVPVDSATNAAAPAGSTVPAVGLDSAWRAPVEGADRVIARRGASVFCPDEAASNGLTRCLEAGSVTEVLAEEVCMAWTIGTVEAGHEAVFASYEAFAPLVMTQLAQYAKLVARRRPRRTPPLGVLVTSLGWANSPTHQNADFAGVFINRPSRHIHLICPLGATSAEQRLDALISDTRDGVFALLCSKQALPDLPDPGGSVVAFSPDGLAEVHATLVAAGDVCVSEALAAMHIAAAQGLCIRVIAVVELTALDPDRSPARLPIHDARPIIGAVWCAPAMLRGLLWGAFGRIFPVHGYIEEFGATPWETLVRNRLDRYSLLRALWPGELISPWCDGVDEFQEGPSAVPFHVLGRMRVERVVPE
ncbi:hypothetical protein [Sorangium sp. So ce388]|uniref:phosphoketolase family protein n=1 Tax=Sorangium sp. So ce388 TaxID=3133309 RepID=UPI003F5C2B2E